MLDEGHEALETLNFKRAHVVARKLHSIGYTGEFEIAARAYWQEGKRRKAIRTLESATRKHPAVPILWSYLGEFYSETGRYDEAIYAFEKSASGPHGERALADLNVAVVLWRRKEYQAAILKLNLIPPGTAEPDPSSVELVRAHCLLSLERTGEALQAVDEGLALSVSDRPKVEASLLALRAKTLLKMDDRNGAQAAAWKAIAIDKSADVAEIIREIGSTRSATAKLWRVRIGGTWCEPLEPGGSIPKFTALYWVIAEDAAQALELIRPFEDARVRASLQIIDAKSERSAPEELVGVVRALGGYTFVLP